MEVKGRIDACKTPEELIKVNADYITAAGMQLQNANSELSLSYGEFAGEALEVAKALRQYASAKKAELLTPKVNVEAVEEVKVEAVAIMEEQLDLVTVAEKASQVTASTGIRKTWKATVIDFSLVPDSMKEIVMSKVNEQMRNLKDLELLVDGQTYIENGIKYEQVESVTLK